MLALKFQSIAQHRKLTIRPTHLVPPEQLQMIAIQIHPTHSERGAANCLCPTLDGLNNPAAKQQGDDQSRKSGRTGHNNPKLLRSQCTLDPLGSNCLTNSTNS